MIMGYLKIAKMKKWTWLIVFAAIVVGCETNRDTFEDFVREGETIYVTIEKFGSALPPSQIPKPLTFKNKLYHPFILNDVPQPFYC